MKRTIRSPNQKARAISPGVTEDNWLGGKLRLRQPDDGYRVAIDAILLAAATPLAPGGRAMDLGAGVGAATMALAWRTPDAVVDGVEIQAELQALAIQNATLNGLAQRARVQKGDVQRLARPAEYDAVFLNPPYLTPEANDPTADPQKRIATTEGPARLPDWMSAAARVAKPGGDIVLIHRADRLADILAAAAAADIGGLTIFPLWPKAGVAARRIIVKGRKAKGGRLTLAAGLVLHEGDGAYTAEAERILQGDATLAI